MIIIPVKEGENIERALKRFKRKFEKTGVIKELRERQVFTKPSVKRRTVLKKAVYIQGLQRQEDWCGVDGSCSLVSSWRMDYQESFIHYLKYEKRNSSHTVVAYENDLNQFIQFGTEMIENFELIKTDRKIVREWVVHLMEMKLSARSVHRKASTIQAFFKYLMKLELIDANPVHNIPLPKIRKKLPFFVEEKNLHHLLDDGFFTPDFSGERDKLVIALLYGTGIRLSELLKLKKGDVDLVQNQIKVIGKRNKERIIPFSRSLRPEIETYLMLKNETFPESPDVIILTDKGEPAYDKLIYRIVKNYLTKVTLLEKKSPHVLRHTYATHLLNKGADLNAVKELLGHANLGATEIYTHTTFEKLHSIYQQAHPRG